MLSTARSLILDNIGKLPRNRAKAIFINDNSRYEPLLLRARSVFENHAAAKSWLEDLLNENQETFGLVWQVINSIFGLELIGSSFKQYDRQRSRRADDTAYRASVGSNHTAAIGALGNFMYLLKT